MVTIGSINYMNIDNHKHFYQYIKLGLKKYISSTSQLFNHKSSRADILSLSVDEKEKAVIVTWRLEGTVKYFIDFLKT